MDKLTIKTQAEIEIMAEGGKKLARIRDEAVRAVEPGMTTAQLDKLVDELMAKAGGKASFKMVRGYHHATCININDIVVHGMPGNYKIKSGDKVGIDLGLYYKGFHTDTSVTIGDDRYKKFLQVGRDALQLSIAQARPGKRIGHGIGKNLHEDPAIPCFVVGKYEHSPKIVAGMALAIEIMYNEGGLEVAYENDDGWTIVTSDGKISGLFEETVAVTKSGPVVLTQSR
ncbi:M24 family metallopeptidase [Candidatus Amesbacteria bacterium]|nr:M24 family metallopeptidase [Candidatus Amesbacteria bacterium]